MGKRILVIDDDRDILSIMDIILGEQGYQVMLYDNGTTAEQIKLLRPDVILLDIRIAGFYKSGAEICKEIKSEFELSGIPVLLVSAEIDVASLAASCGADGYVNKPFDIDTLLSTVKQFIS
jgi:two-component system response regulator VicR